MQKNNHRIMRWRYDNWIGLLNGGKYYYSFDFEGKYPSIHGQVDSMETKEYYTGQKNSTNFKVNFHPHQQGTKTEKIEELKSRFETMFTVIIVDVLFRKYKETGSIIALMPYENEDSGKCLSYMKVGQHSEADYQHIMRLTKPALEDEYRALKKELNQTGYHVNVIKKRSLKRK